jgi:TRAP transporter TAXI family solute receptor
MRALFLLGTALLLAACSAGPDETALRKDVTDRVAQALPPGTVSMTELQRRGSQSDTKAPSGETRRIIYFDSELTLDRDFDFGAWDSPGVAGVVSALGTGPKGIVGIASGGNKAGDRIVAHGTALYRKDGNAWVPVVSAGFAATSPPAYAGAAAQAGAVGILDSMRTVVASAPKDITPATRALIEQELATAHASIRAALARASDGYAIAAGPEHGEYLRFVQALAAARKARVVPLITRGGEENLRLLRDGKVSFALSQADAAQLAYEGKGNFTAQGPHLTLRAIGSLYPEPIQVIARSDGPITSVSQLAGRRVVVGPVGSASRITAMRVLEAHGIDTKDPKRLADLPLNEALVALRDKRIDAVIQVIGVPADSIRNALVDVPLRLVPLSERAVASLTASNAGYFPYTIQRGAYATQKQDVRTIATSALLLVGSDLAESEVGAITRYVFGEQRDFAALGSIQGARVSAAQAQTGLSIPMHIAAAKALEGLAKPRASQDPSKPAAPPESPPGTTQKPASSAK